ncbi:uncharacterized protein CANTADRAFT_190049 [Suhomyces tanzawaensis NRRL Y-17324]|uniref:Secreted protein n=1 Tax=Suhomyces tanzawaensis NRRL Y-17324 TaxID=984487 RepID=A0A1E4SNG4_9ASCO|nr:uncharacterized protein CANTADRAFT_190049 [Suhomyces tanzawaensis NRRL Y-17324]ODV81064.1 hypothetical protein CANTADRAFT_190049 [Suhomyces tanzawaensis NRRL Y-17324]
MLAVAVAFLWGCRGSFTLCGVCPLHQCELSLANVSLSATPKENTINRLLLLTIALKLFVVTIHPFAPSFTELSS